MRDTKFYCDDCGTEVDGVSRSVSLNVGSDRENPTILKLSYEPHFEHFCNPCIVRRVSEAFLEVTYNIYTAPLLCEKRGE